MYDVRLELAQLLQIQGAQTEDIAKAIVVSEDESKGDYCLPVFRFAKSAGMNPMELAKQTAQDLSDNKPELLLKVEAVGGYVNMFVDKRAVSVKIIKDILDSGEHYGESDVGKGKTICIDYSSINIAKPFHIGHLGTTAIGNSLCRVLSLLSYNCVGINHLGDWGTQFGKMIVAYKLWGDKEKIDKGGLRELQKIYVRFHVEAETDSSLDDQAREWFAKIEKGDKEALELFEYFKAITLDEIRKLYDRLGVKFDSWNGESFYNDKIAGTLEFLENKGLVEQSEGAKVVNLSKYDMPPCLLVKKDGASLYATRDLAAIFYRKAAYDFDKCLYVVAYQQNLHFKQIFKVVELAGLDYYKDLVHVAYGMVSIEEGSMSTRKGNTVWLSDVIDRAVAKALLVIEEKNPTLPNKQEVAEQVGVGAVMFSPLAAARIKDITFSFDRVLSFEGETAPYLQYTHARCCSLRAKAESFPDSVAPDVSAYDNALTLQLCKLLAKFPSVLLDVGAKYEPCLLSNYLLDLAKSFNKYYFEQRILAGTAGEQKARLILCDIVAGVLKKGLYLLGIGAPDRM